VRHDRPVARFQKHGTTKLLEALDLASGKVVGRHYKRRRRIEFLNFMNHVVASHPEREIRVVLDNLSIHKPNRDMWLKKHKNVHFYYTPTHSLWLNQIEIWFSKFAFVQLHEKATRRIAGDFLRALVAAVPYTIHTVLTDNGTQFTDNTPVGKLDVGEPLGDEPVFWRRHSFDLACEQNGIQQRLTKPYHPWTNGQVERMNRTIKEATVRRYHYESHDELRRHLQLFIDAYNFGRRLKTLRGFTPYEFVCKLWTEQPNRFKLNPSYLMPGPNI
jgi:hypothetical protein